MITRRRLITIQSKFFHPQEDAVIYRSQVFEYDKALKSDFIRNTYDVIDSRISDTKVIRFLDGSRYCYEIIEKSLE